MNCPKCDQQNPDNAPLCSSCGYVLSWDPAELTAARARLSKPLRLAVVSLVLGILSIPTWAITAILAIVLGIVSLVKIEKGGGRLTGKGYAAIGIAIPAILCSLAGVFALTAKVRYTYRRLVCATHLRSTGVSILIYMNDWDDGYPLAGSSTTKWGLTPNWQAKDRSAAFGLEIDGEGGQASVSASVFMMCRSYLMGGLTDFVCPDDSGTTPFNPSLYAATPYDWGEFWDFGPDPSKHLSYTYHMPYGPYPLTKSCPPAMPVMADKNPWLDAFGYTARTKRDFDYFDPTGHAKEVGRGNAIPHRSRGQNVLFVDVHVTFEKSSACGLNGDNIYTSWSGPDIKKGSIPTLKSQPADPNDSLLVHDPPAGDFK